MFVIRDANGGNNPYKSITQQHLATTFADNVTIQQSNGELRILPLSVTAAHITDDTITEVKLSIGNAPSNNNLLGWDGSAMQWVASIAPATWAVENNLDLIPVNKFDDAHTPLDWASTGNTDNIPFGKIPGTLIHLATTVTYAQQVFTVTTENTVELGDLILLETPSAWTENDLPVQMRVNATASVALTDREESGLLDSEIESVTWYLITRNTNASTWSVVTSLSGLNLGQVRNQIADWAETGNTDDIPTGKIPGTLIHLATTVTYTPITFSVTTDNTVEIGDLILLETPAAWTESAALIGIDVNGTGITAFTDRAENSLTDQDISPETWYLVARNSSATAWSVVTSLRGLTRPQVRGEIADWAETSNTDLIPASKIPAGGGTGDDAYDWATEGDTDLIPVDKLPGRQVWLASLYNPIPQIANITVPGFTGDLPEGDLLIFTVTVQSQNNLAISFRINGEPAGAVLNSEGDPVVERDLQLNSTHIMTRTAGSYYLLESESFDWALVGNTDLIPNAKLDGLLAQVMAGTNLTIDRTTAGEITLNATAGGGGTQTHFPIPNADVSGINNIVLTSGASLTSLP